MNDTQIIVYNPTPKFLLTTEDEINEIRQRMKSQNNKYQQAANKLASLAIPHYKIIMGLVKLLYGFIKEKEELQEKLFDLKIEWNFLKRDMNELHDRMESTEFDVEKIGDDNESIRLAHIPITFNVYREILCNFKNSDHSFYSHPLITAPCLITFARLYKTILDTISVYPVYENEAKKEMRVLREVLGTYKKIPLMQD